MKKEKVSERPTRERDRRLPCGDGTRIPAVVPVRVDDTGCVSALNDNR